MMLDSIKKKNIAKRVKSLEEDILKAREYLEVGAHSNWHKFQPIFSRKVKDGKTVPPHKDWVRNVFLPNLERELRKAEELLDRIG